MPRQNKKSQYQSLRKLEKRTSISLRIGNIEANLTFSNASRREREKSSSEKHLLRYGRI